MQIKRYQEGGATPAAPAPAPQGGEEQMMQQLAQMAQEIIQQLGPDAAAMLAQVIMEMLQGGTTGSRCCTRGATVYALRWKN